MANYNWPISLIENYNVPSELMFFLDKFAMDSFRLQEKLEELHKEHEMLKDTSSKQNRYIAELEKQLSILQKTLDLIDKNGGGEDGRTKNVRQDDY